ncbi:MAG: type IV secretion system DNA-binding domain-containing protein [Candidatus Liptonbacteria bacterium]|nr:type IV secretion system DNA-binding domain-containing protein [Candidatus Liptonbacteria bacterium]
MPFLSQDVVYFGRTDFRNAKRLFGIKRNDRRQHMYVVGKTGTGKTALLHNMVVQDITNGEGVCVVDPHGEFVESLLSKIPEERLKDVIYFNPADTDYPMGFNPLELPDQKYKHLAASGLMAIFTKIWANVWSARMEYILNNAILALLETPGSTLLGVNRILVDKDFRQKIIVNVKDPVVKAFWTNEFEAWRDQFRNEAIAPIQNKVGQFLSTDLIRNVVGQPKSTIDIFEIINTRKIFLVNVSKGRIGEDNSALLGAMLITKIQLSAMERVRIPEEERADFYLYVDEFQNFATDSFAGILSEARKYRLNLILAHQYIGQLVTDVSTKVRDAVFGNCGTMVIFRIGATDAEFLENELTPEFLPEDMVNLPNYAVYLKLMVNGITSRPFSAATLPPFKVPTSSVTIEKVLEDSRKNYTRSRYEVESQINSWSGMMGDVVGGDEEKARSGVEPGGKLPEGQKIAATCSSCGKRTELNFVPTEGRPIYCRDCLAKIKTGEMPRVKVGKVKVAKPQDKYFSDLAGLGIEFEEDKKKEGDEEGGEGSEPSRRPGGLATPTGRGIKEMAEASLKKEVSLHLSDLKPNEKERTQKPKKTSGLNIEELRRSITEALENQTAVTKAEDSNQNDFREEKAI